MAEGGGMFGRLPGWWMSPPAWINLALTAAAFGAHAHAAILLWRRHPRMSAAALEHLAVASLAGVWVVALGLRTTGVITRSTYFEVVGPFAPVAFAVVWLLPGLNAVTHEKARRRSLGGGR